MKETENLLEDLIHLAETLENDWLANRLREIKEVKDNTPNDMELGSKLRKML